MSFVDLDVQAMSIEDLRTAIMQLRNSIRLHRDEKDHDRCWASDILLYLSLPEKTVPKLMLPNKTDWQSQCANWCQEYWLKRQPFSESCLISLTTDVDNRINETIKQKYCINIDDLDYSISQVEDIIKMLNNEILEINRIPDDLFNKIDVLKSYKNKLIMYVLRKEKLFSQLMWRFSFNDETCRYTLASEYTHCVPKERRQSYDKVLSRISSLASDNYHHCIFIRQNFIKDYVEISADRDSVSISFDSIDSSIAFCVQYEIRLDTQTFENEYNALIKETAEIKEKICLLQKINSALQ